MTDYKTKYQQILEDLDSNIKEYEFIRDSAKESCRRLGVDPLQNSTYITARIVVNSLNAIYYRWKENDLV